MKQKFIDSKKYPKKCSSCAHARVPEDKSMVLCEKKGIVDPDSCCRKYEYDPLKRIPLKSVISTDFTAEDFSL